MNKQFFFGQYRRINSYFEGMELACSGLPHGEELKILEPLRDQVPEVFTTPYANPVAGTPEKVRANLPEGMRLMREAGYEVRDHRQAHPRTGKVLSVEFLTVTSDPSGAERVIHFYKPALARLGVEVTVRSATISSTRIDCATSTSTSSSPHGAVPVARQRATRLVELAGGRHARLAQLRRQIPQSMP